MGKDNKAVPPEVFIAADLVYAGRRTINGDQLVCQLHLIRGNELEEARLFLPELFQGKVIGGIYTGASFTADRASGLERITYTGRWDDSRICIDWTAQDEAAMALQRRQEMEADARLIHDIDELLQPIRQLYSEYRIKGDLAGQEALENAVLRSLRRSQSPS